jgi:2-(1,2-epoxy-1,2-dihydrophenyl)acetyl-CoA isomerase
MRMERSKRMVNNQSVKYEISDGLAVITLNEPNSLNALSPQVTAGLLSTIEKAEADSEVKIVILTGEGRAFCAGGDITNMGDRTTLESVEKMNNVSELIIRIAEMKKPIISAVNGYAMGAGFSLALATDIIIAQKNAKFGLSFINVGLVPDCGLLHFLPKIVGPWKAKELIFSGAVLTASESFEYQIVNRLVEDNEAMNEAKNLANSLANSPLQTMTLVKTILGNSQTLDLKGTLQFENMAQAILQQTTDHKEGIKAFKEKRIPSFIDK